PIGTHSNRFEVIDSLTRLDAANNQLLLVRSIGRNDERDVLSDSLLRCVAEEAFGSSVPALDYALQGLGNNGVFRRLHDGRQKTGGSELSRLSALPLTPFADVTKYQDTTDDLALFIANGGGAVVDGAFSAVLRYEDRTLGQPAYHSLAQGSLDGVVDGFAA